MAEGGKQKRNSRAELTQETVRGNYFGFKTKSCQSDMELKVGGDTLYVNQVVLEMASPVLKKIFDEKLHDADKNGVTLEDENAEGFCEFLACFYPSCEHEIEISNVFRILPLANKYKVDRLMKKSVTLLMQSLTKKQAEEHIYQCLSVARKHCITSMEDKCIELLIDMYKTDVHRADEMLTRKADVKLVVMSAMIPFLRSEANKFRFLSDGPKGVGSYLDLDDFQDAKYSAVEIRINHNTLMFPFSRTVKLSTLTVWDINLDIKVSDMLEFSCTCTRKTKSNYKVAVKMIFKNHIPGEKHIWIGNVGETPLCLNYKGDLSLARLGFRWNDMYTTTIHVLMDRPAQVPED